MKRSRTSAITKLQVVIIAAVIVVAIVAGGTYFLLPTSTTKGPIKVGLLLSWTGAGATQAAEIEKGVRIWATRINNEGGLLGREVNIVPVDTETDPAKGRIAFERLVVQEQVDAVIGPFLSAELMAVLPLANQYKIPTISPMGTTMAANPLMANGTYAWRTTGNNVVWSSSVVGTLKDVVIPALKAKYGMKEEDIVLQFIRGDDEASRDIGQRLGQFLSDAGIKAKQLDTIVMSFSVTDFTNEIRIIQSRKPDIVIALAIGASSAIFTKQTREYDSHFVVMGFGEISTSPTFWEAAKEERVGAIGMAYSPIWTRLTNNTETYNNLFVQTIGGIPSPASAQGYDSCLVLENAIKNAGTTEKEAVGKAIAKVDFVGLKTRMQFITDPTAYNSHDIANYWYAMAQYQPTPSVIPQGTPLFNTTAHGLRCTLVWPTSVAEGPFWIPDYYVPSANQ